MAAVSLCMIVRDEEDVLGRCLDSVKDAVDEIIIIDTGSEDRTKETALKYTQNVYDFPWRDDFSAARNFALEHGRKLGCKAMRLDTYEFNEPAAKLYTKLGFRYVGITEFFFEQAILENLICFEYKLV